jgi:hypothetical protein
MWTTLLYGFVPVVLLYLIYYFFFLVKHPKLHFQATPQNKKLLSLCPSLTTRYWPSLHLAYNGVVHSVIGIFLPIAPKIRFFRQLVTCRDGGIVSLDWWEPKEHKDNITLMVLPGFEGGSNSTYIRRFVRTMSDNGYKCVVMNFRASVDAPITPKLHNISDASDLIDGVAEVVKKTQGDTLIAMGFSLGANYLVKYLSEEGRKVPFKAAISFGNPFDLLELERVHNSKPFWSRVVYHVYHLGAARSVKKKLLRHKKVFQDVEKLDWEAIANSKTLMELSHHFSATLYGLDSGNHYYELASSRMCLNKESAVIAIPLLCVNAEDDPIVPVSCVPFEVVDKHSNILMAMTRNGGHLGWRDINGENWAEKLGIEFINAVLKL